MFQCTTDTNVGKTSLERTYKRAETVENFRLRSKFPDFIDKQTFEEMVSYLVTDDKR